MKAVRNYIVVTTMIAAVLHLRCLLFDSRVRAFCVTTVSCHCAPASPPRRRPLSSFLLQFTSLFSLYTVLWLVLTI